MKTCKRCQAFLHDYIDQNIRKCGTLEELGNAKNIRKNLNDFIQAILRSSSSVNEILLYNMKGEAEMRMNLIKKPESKEEEYLLKYYILSQIAPAFKEEVKDVYSLVATYDMVKLKREDKSYGRIDQFLANLYIPILEAIHQIHKEHSGECTGKCMPVTPLKVYQFDEMDLLYS
jgi:hypothetical protein